MLIGISGTHGTGKSSILRGLAEHQSGSANKLISIDTSQLSRTAQAALGWDTLEDATSSIEKVKEFQEAILAAMFDRDSKYLDSPDITFVERTPADVAAYAAYWITVKHAEEGTADDSVWLTNFQARCRVMAAKYESIVIVPSMAEIPLVEDKNRAAADSRFFVEKRIEYFVKKGGLRHFEIKSAPIHIRVAETFAHAVIVKLERSDRHGEKANNT